MRKFFLTLSALFFLLINTQAQNRTITGKITDENGQGIQGVSVLVKGTRIGTETNADGNFSLSVPASARTLVISSINMATKEVSIKSGSIDVSLTTKANNLEEVVVVGYGTQKKSDVTASITKVGGDKVAGVPLSSVDQILQGKVAGLQSATFSGQPGANQQIRIRATASFSVSSQPLY